MPLTVQENIRLAPYTTLRLGGPARYLASCSTVDDVAAAIEFAATAARPLFVLGGGSNVVVADRGFDGLVLLPCLKGIAVEEDGDHVVVTAAAGEVWDDLVRFAVDRGYGGIECLSGIPGSVGATPIQNVGAYGQEVSETIVAVEAVDRRTRRRVEFSHDECRFGYRRSRFKEEDRDRYVITGVRFRFPQNARPSIRYPEVKEAIARSVAFSRLPDGTPALSAVRDAVLSIRRAKSMVVDPADPHSRSAGSFFVNPVLPEAEFDRMCAAVRLNGFPSEVPSFPSDGGRKIPAAWLVEHAGFSRGFRRGNVGISAHHALALVNYGGTTSELLALARDVQAAVRRYSGVSLVLEPVLLE